MNHNIQASQPPSNPDRAATVICKGFVFTTWLVMISMLVSRIIWMRWIWLSVQSDGPAQDVPTPEDEHRLPLGFGYGILYFEPSLLLCLLGSAAFLLLVYFARRTFDTRSFTLLVTLRCLFFYSAFMIFVQIVFLSVATPQPYHRFLFNTALMRHGTEIISFDDPHYITLIISIVALLLLIDRNIFQKLRRLLRHSDEQQGA